MIIGTVGRLGVGKTASGVLEAYRDYCLKRQVYANIWLSFPHIPVKTPYDFITITDGFLLADELWGLIDNRKSMSKLNDVMTLIMIRSRKKDFDVFYTQQFLQIDVRIKFVTDFWIRPLIIRDSSQRPVWLIQKIWDADFTRFPDRIIDCRPYLDMFKTKSDPYTLKASLTDESMQDALEQALTRNPRLETEMSDLRVKAEKSERTKKEIRDLID